MGTTVHVGLCEHEVEVRADGVGEGEGGDPADERFGAVEGLRVGGGGYDGVVVGISVGAYA